MAETKLTKKELDDLRTRLQAEEIELQTQLTTIEEDTFATTQSEMVGDVGLDDESADAGTATFEREKDLSIENNVRDLLQKIERALKRIEDGTYGTCDRCGKPIEKARIKALPYVDLCIKDAQAQTRR
jgi:RNA polymerase-binding protein DksA